MNAHGCDVSKHQYPINYKLGRERGLSFAIPRVSIGDYYTDPTFLESFHGYKEAGILVSGYLVTAPRDPNLTRKISAQAHLDRFLRAVEGLTPDLPWVIDAELQREESKTYITQLHRDIVTRLHQVFNEYPLIYTRQSWWDYYLNPDPLWANCPLWAARYAPYLTSPWSDGLYKFRDWTEWKFWQYTDRGDGKYFGVTSLQLDLDWFNGTEKDLYNFAGLEAPLSLEDKVNILWREADAHGWNLNR